MENKNVKLALEGSIIKGLFYLSIPILIGNLLQASYNFVDAYWIGSISKEAVAGVSASFPIIFFIISLGSGFSMAGTILIAQYVGAKNKKMVNKIASQTLFLDIFLAIILGAIGYFSSEYILENIMNVDKDVMKHSVDFLKINFLGLTFYFVFSMFQSILRGIGEVKLPMYIIFGTLVLNFIIDPILIKGLFGFPALGVSGAAIATLLSNIISSSIGIFILIKGNYGIKLDLKNIFPTKKFLKKIFFLGLPSSIEMSARSFGMVIMTSLVASFGTVALAGFGAGGNIFQFIFIPAMGFSIAVSTMVGQNLGAKNFKRAEKIVKISSFISFITLEIIGILIFIFAPFLIQIFIHNDPETVQVGVDLMRISSLTFGAMGVQFAINGVFRASGNTTLSMNLSMISMFVIQFPVAFLLSQKVGLEETGVWWSFAITNIAMMLLTIAIFLRGNWKNKNLTKEENL